MTLAEQLRDLLTTGESSIYEIAKATGISQPALQEFARGKSDGSYPDLKLSTAQKLIDHYGLTVSLPRRRKKSA